MECLIEFISTYIKYFTSRSAKKVRMSQEAKFEFYVIGFKFFERD